MESILFLVIGLAAGAAIGFFLAKLKVAEAGKAQQDLQIQLARGEENLLAWEKKFIDLDQRNSALQSEFQGLLSENASLKAEGRALTEKLEGQKKELEELHQKMSLEFKNLAHEIFE